MTKKIIKIVLLIVAGFIIGFLVASIGSIKIIAFINGSVLLEMAADVYQLQKGEADQVLERKRKALPPLTQRYDRIFSRWVSEKQRSGVLWQVARCYEGDETAVPASIKPILEALPPRLLTSCELKRMEEAGKTEKTSSSAASEAPCPVSASETAAKASTETQIQEKE